MKPETINSEPRTEERRTKNQLANPAQQLQIRVTQKNQFNLYLPPVKITTPYIIVLEVENSSSVSGQYQDAKT